MKKINNLREFCNINIPIWLYHQIVWFSDGVERRRYPEHKLVSDYSFEIDDFFFRTY